jgi:hypothetical protein
METKNNKKEKSVKLTTLHETKIVYPNSARATKIFNFNSGEKSYKFKLIYDLRNGGSDLDLYIMSSDGEFKYVLNKNDIGHLFTVSYISDTFAKDQDIKEASKLVEIIIHKIYQ